MQAKTRSEKHGGQYLMENIQIVLKRGNMLQPPQFKQMLELSSFDDLSAYLGQYGYDLPERDIAPNEIDQLYQSLLSEVREFMVSLNIPVPFCNAFFIYDDSVNALGKIPVAQFDEILLERYVETANTKLHPLITEMCKTKIDFYFLQCCFRKKAMSEKAKRMCIGFVTKEDCDRLYGQNYQTIWKYLTTGHYARLLSPWMYKANVDVVFDCIIHSYFRPYQKMVRGIGPVFSYIYDKKMELFDLRCLLKGKWYHFSEEDLRKVMRNLYV